MVALLLGAALALRVVPALGQCEADAGPPDDPSPGALLDTFPADEDQGVPTDAVVRLRFVVGPPTGVALTVVEEDQPGSPNVEGRIVVVGGDMVWQAIAALRADTLHAVQVSGSLEPTFTLRFRTGRGPASNPPVFGGITGLSTRAADSTDCDPEAQNITVHFDRAEPPRGTTGWPAADVEYVIYETRGPGIAGPRERDRTRLQSSGSDLDRSARRTFRLAGREAGGPVCFNVQALDPNGRADGNAVERCVNPAAGNYFSGCGAAPRCADPATLLGVGLTGTLLALGHHLRRRRLRRHHSPSKGPMRVASSPTCLFLTLALTGGCATRTLAPMRSLPSRLPPMRCADSVEGQWEGQVYLPTLSEWTRLSLTIRRSPEDPNRLTGEMSARYWLDDGHHEALPRCEAGTYDRAVRMSAEGIARGNQIEFAGTALRPVEAPCGGAATPGSYALDRIVGTLEPSGTEMRALDNDGDAAADVPITLWRVACATTAARP